MANSVTAGNGGWRVKRGVWIGLVLAIALLGAITVAGGAGAATAAPATGRTTPY
jgi:hypothetical protein